MAATRELGASEENWSRCTAAGTGIGVFGIAIKQLIDTRHLIVAAKRVCENHAILRAQLVGKSKSNAASFTVRDNASWAPVIESLPWPIIEQKQSTVGILVLPGDNDDKEHTLSIALHQIVRNELNLPFQNAAVAPIDLFQIHVYVEASNSHTIIVLRFHSGACDRHSTAVAAKEFLKCLSDSVDAQPLQIPTSSDKDGLLPSMEDLLPKAKASKGFLKKGLDAVGYAINSTKSTLLPFQSGFAALRQNTFKTEILNYSLGVSDTEALVAACKRETTTIAATLSAAFLKAAANVKELKDKKQDTFSFTNVLNCRPYFESRLDDNVIGNYSAGLPADEQVKEGTTFWDLARHISAATEKSLSKSHHFSELSVLNMLLSQVVKHPNITPQSSMRTALFTLFVDGPMKLSYDDISDNLKLAGTLGPMASMHFVGPCFSVAEELHDGPDLHLSFIYTDPVHSRSQLETFCSSAFKFLTGALELKP